LPEHLTPAFLLHRRPYRDTSALLELLSLAEGRVGLVARGVARPKSRLSGVLRPFVPLLVRWSGRGELGTLIAAEEAHRMVPLPGKRLAHGLYLNEVTVKLLGRHEAVPELFACYQYTLEQLAGASNTAPTLRRFERTLLACLGLDLALEADSAGQPLDPDARYGYNPEAGPYRLETKSGEQHGVRGSSLLAFARDQLEDAQTLHDALQITRLAINHQLAGHTLRSRELLYPGRARYKAGEEPRGPR
jgi:DNA repair protein RecO (recombination protein O)